MLILDRVKGQSIRIGDDVRVVLIDCRHGRAKLGIEADRSIPVHREEIWIRINREQTLTPRDEKG